MLEKDNVADEPNSRNNVGSNGNSFPENKIVFTLQKSDIPLVFRDYMDIKFSVLSQLQRKKSIHHKEIENP